MYIYIYKSSIKQYLENKRLGLNDQFDKLKIHTKKMLVVFIEYIEKASLYFKY